MARILLVDDDDSFRKMLRLTLVKMGHDLIEANDGTGALELCEAALPNIALIDIIMPEKDGLETIRELRRANPLVHIIAMSGGGRGNAADYLKVAKQMGAVCTLNKPFSKEALEEAIAIAVSLD